ncbi:retrovirus-related pol polyprotein from transposon TNT 1-94 [Tanacetum coccineum]
MVTSSSLSLDDSTSFSNLVKYRQVVVSLQYVTLSRSDIAFAINQILRYLHGTVEHGMLIRRSSGYTLQDFTDVLWKGNPDTSLEAFSDADWAGDSEIDEAEYKALADTVAELTWLQALLHELGIRSSLTHMLWNNRYEEHYCHSEQYYHGKQLNIIWLNASHYNGHVGGLVGDVLKLYHELWSLEAKMKVWRVLEAVATVVVEREEMWL